MSWLRPANGWSADGSNAPGVLMKEPTSSLVGEVNVGYALIAGSCIVLSDGDAVCVCFGLPVNASQMPILACDSVGESVARFSCAECA